MDEDNGERKAFISRIGTLLLLMGVLVVILFIASDLGDQTYFRYFFIGVVLIAAGFIFKRMAASAPSPGKRFEGIRKIQQQRREAKAKKQAAKKDSKKKR
jgi:hypothetical protein